MSDSWEKKFWATREAEKRDEEPSQPNNRIFLNFTREPREPAKDSFRVDKVKKLFEFISENEEIREMKVYGCLEKDESEEECADEEDGEEGLDGSRTKDACYSEDSEVAVREGHVFPMSRDFWYRRLNILKARKLDEAALEAKDIPEEDLPAEVGVAIPSPKTHRTCLEEPTGGRESVFQEMEEFERRVSRPAESQLRAGFVNIYDNRVHFCHKADTYPEKKEK